ncbi:MAG: Ig-like domain-containing protein [Verrucomicrobiota bacterium]
MTKLKNQIAIGHILLTAMAMVVNIPANGQTVNHGISAAHFNVVQNDTSNTTSSVTVTTAISINEFSLRDGSNRGDYNVQVGLGFSDDVDSGVMLSCIAENGRNNGETNNLGINYCTSTIDYARSGANTGAYYISTFNAPTGGEYNINVAAAFFPYTNWLGGLARNSGDTNGGANDLFTGSPGLVLGTHFVDNGDGTSTVNLTNRGINSQTDGVLLVTHGKNEDNYALSSINTNGTWTVYVKDNGSDTDATEQDPVAFVFIPKTNTTVVSGRFRGDGTRLMYSGATPSFNVTNTDAGTWRLTIPGFSPAKGVLIISAEGGASQNQDNIVSYEPDGDGWIIQSRDLPNNPPGLQTPGSGTQAVASFVFIPSAATVTLVSPADAAQNQTISPALKVSVSNSAAENLTVRYFGRVAVGDPSPDFAIALLPDTQFYTDEINGGTKEMFIAQTEWIITNRVSQNIAYVAHLGDISNNGDIIGGSPNTSEWRNATNAMYRLENPTRTLLQFGIPYGMAVGNHDLEPIGDPTGTSIYFNQYFGISRFTGKPYYAGHYGTNNNNHFDFFSASGLDFVVLYFEFDSNANPTVLAWGNQVLQTNQNRRAIVVTHNFGGSGLASNFSAQGLAIYNALKANTNLFLMVAGHVTGEYARTDTFNGNTVRTYVQDFQGWTNGGNGFMRTMTFSPHDNQVVVQTFSPYTGEYETDANSEFIFSYNMQTPLVSSNSPFALIGTASNVPPGSVTQFVWSNRQKNTAYEWYAVVTDGSNNTTTSPIWQFATAPNLAPVATNRTVTVFADGPTNLVLTASDANGDTLTFKTNSQPSRGLNSNFNPANGTITYSPARSFRGVDQFTFSATDGSVTSAIVTLNLNVVSPPDLNGNGLPDSWENLYGITSPNADDDGDGYTNLGEYFANTNPTNAASVLHISQVSRATNGHVSIVWPTVGGTRYRVQFSNSGANGTFTGAFTDIFRSLNLEMDGATYGSESTQTFVDDFTLTGNPGTNQARYYRVKLVP